MHKAATIWCKSPLVSAPSIELSPGHRGRNYQPRCEGCGLPPVYCVCPRLEAIESKTRVVVVMHRNERLKMSNTGRIVARLLTRAEVRVRGTLTNVERPLPEGRRLVLFPGTAARELTAADAAPDNVLLVPDGSWSQARKLAHRDPLLAEGEWVRLPDGTAESNYRLRRNRRPGGVCTIEAIARTLRILEEDPALEAHLLAGFDLFQRRADSVQHHGNEDLPHSRMKRNAGRPPEEP